MKIEDLKFGDNGLIPAVVQDASTREVLTVAYMNEESLGKSLETRETWFYSRSRQELWHKGATSGNTQKIVEIKYDCDGDALVVLVEPAGPSCHTGAESCFSENLLDKTVTENTALTDFAVMLELEKTIREREQDMPEGAYTTYLFEKGVDKILKKVGEEAAEVIIAAKNRDPEELKWEAADLLYHLMVLLQEQKLPLKEVLGVLNKRKKPSAGE
ncbi:bifunctional phosphoribosyl-AMP cyclohydrolase/phosphoribosyl-ATP diphosphatase HisIE [Mesobacillus sp. AQ2]|uniref:bifunctional phosphoribosyl-AMP cyclohydrolase/phosphoribosyl-ATP diphosphatase HisIE n=1 Tax=unclassified Mesobacillus TaxID=2675270 RepID=UPI00203D552B|nr:MULTISPECIES: bifunctional phosphoribosyl-AMP cyclohydrolase/phosphoribosyl-ATP diphosphatase HisIE [unclassified Mesobacillus]MCM3124050.1 bifunctional phosphoribosyl-AMP cyclohydrolase/phosphoribosyl-ATP diphosphatase HisIE [Mesobacillus sp. MER 33]MCM3233899.1 bifunctional phosphoribosyl-AMP cyclohydrolase/phosphoribosyl-ATP diphosphatase HisIE [Mesobacillus sp. MER 48]WHX40148.1 bifunctional phosphoribosyl-AMP cyclohydrolase/phosphoribosyl-ATP diphosphatase HisIE [Mesobacillus sp. AQ2]